MPDIIIKPPTEKLIKFTSKMRVLNLDKDPKRPWKANDDANNPFRFDTCHWGQMKLMYTEVEFLTLAASSHDLTKCTVVSVGAAPGHSVSLLRKMFPDLKFILVDPAKFVAKQDSHVTILNTFFTDSTVPQILKQTESEGRKILFISDIRITVEDESEFEQAVFNDMLSQQRWGTQLNAEMIMVKFRMPFSDERQGPRDMRYDYNLLAQNNSNTNTTSLITLAKSVPKDPNMVQPGKMVYLDGDLRLQLYPPTDSAETRLISKKGKNGKYTLKTYDYLAYEQTMAHYNSITRRRKYTYPNSTMIAQNIGGFDPTSFESASEVCIVNDYLRLVLGRAYKNNQEEARETTQLIFAIHRDMWQVTSRTRVSCNIRTPLAASKNRNFSHVISRLIKTQSHTGVLYDKHVLKKMLDTAVNDIIEQTTKQIVIFSDLIKAPQATTKTPNMFLNRSDYVSQILWLKSELDDIKTLHATYNGYLTESHDHGRGNRRNKQPNRHKYMIQDPRSKF